MPYVERENGLIVGIFDVAQQGVAEEWLSADHTDVLAFRNPPAIADDVIAERSRRLALGFDYDFGDARGVHRIGTTPGDMAGWGEVTDIAQSRVARGSTTPIGIVTDTGPVEVTPLEWMDVLEAAAAFRQPIWQASFVLQQMEPIPADCADDGYWPE